MPNQNTPQFNPQQPSSGPPQQQPQVQQTAQQSLPPLGPATRPQLSQAPERSQASRSGRGTRIRLYILAAVSILFVIALIVFFVVRSQSNAPQDTTPLVTPATGDPLADTAAPIDDGTLEEPIRDSDGDGLLDSEEEELRTDPSKIDTDDDGLNDRQELRVYQTDPRNNDSDGDGFDDGEEVRNFFNPNGKGKILDESQLIDELNATQ